MAGERLVEMYARLGDLPTLQRDDVQDKLSHLNYPLLGGAMFSNLAGVTDALLPVWSTFLQFLLIFSHFIREPEGPTLIVICLSSFLVLSYFYANAYNICESVYTKRRRRFSSLIHSDPFPLPVPPFFFFFFSFLFFLSFGGG